jgi:hypothetical protein
MKAIFSAALLIGFCGLAMAAGTAEPVGTWKCEYKIGDQQRTSTLTIKKEGDKLVGAMDWPDQKDEKLKNPQFKEGKLTFSAVRKFMGNTIPIDYTLTIDGDKLKGKGVSDYGNEKREFEIEGKREK